jgi:uncharacterized protein (DUF1330 family)
MEGIPVAADPGRYVRLMGLQVDDQAAYAKYRAGITPFLHAHGGAFGVDLEVSRVLKSAAEGPMNRVFTIGFPSREASDRFHADPAYRAVRAQHFEPAVSRASILAEWGE